MFLEGQHFDDAGAFFRAELLAGLLQRTGRAQAQVVGRQRRTEVAAGESVIMANGTRPGVLDTILAGEPVGTLFLPHGGTVSAWKRWLGYTASPKGRLLVDAGAHAAVTKKGRSLLPIGVVQVQGRASALRNFQRAFRLP